MPSNEWIPCAFQTVVIRTGALSAYPGGHEAFVGKFQARYSRRVVVACSMGGDVYLEQVIDAAVLAGADRQKDMAFIDAFDLVMTSRIRGRQTDGLIKMELPWLEARERGGQVEVRGTSTKPGLLS